MSATSSGEVFRPAVAAEETAPELTFRALLLGAILGIVFGAASTYLALKVGLTISASVPIAVLAAWALRRRNQQRAILEHNIVQTTGSAGESVAAAVVFSVPALIYLGYPLQVGLTTLIALTGGLLGVLMMVPLRRYLIVKEHGVLRYPEGKACAEILQAGEKGGMSARKVFIGLGVGVLFKGLQAVLGGVKPTLEHTFAKFKGAAVGCDFAPEFVGVGYIIGYRTSVMMVAGSVLASFILVPMIAMFGAGRTEPLLPATMLISAMDFGAGGTSIWSNYVRHIGAGAVAVGGLFALGRAFPSIVTSIGASARSLFGGAGSAANAIPLRTERDTPTPVLLFGALAIVAFIWAMPAFQMTLLGAVLILVLGFLFAVVSSRITGEVGSSSCPLSGMTIGVLMATCGVFLLVGWTGSAYSRLALIVGAVICIAISNAGTCSQDLKTGYLVGATPIKQQGALLIGVLASVLAVGWTAYLLNVAETREMVLAKPFAVPSELVARADHTTRVKPDETKAADGSVTKAPLDTREYAYVRLSKAELPEGVAEGAYLVDPATNQALVFREEGIGAGRLRAPQAKLMSVVIDGLLTNRLPWNLILLGAAIAIFVELLGLRSLTFAVGVYLPIAATMPVFIGGCVRWLADRIYKRQPDAEDEPEGTLWCSGLIAGASILGIAAAMLSFVKGYDSDAGLHPYLARLSKFAFANENWFGVAVLALLCALILYGARSSKKA
ncbi:MAG: oligopeptide transporter, OPT family [Planctomycetota bacterium]|nr:MAG: oligopeptide transporter, OPT family [Planctomycetota bacterium]